MPNRLTDNSQDVPDFKNLAHLSSIKSVTCKIVKPILLQEKVEVKKKTSQAGCLSYGKR